MKKIRKPYITAAAAAEAHVAIAACTYVDAEEIQLSKLLGVVSETLKLIETGGGGGGKRDRKCAFY